MNLPPDIDRLYEKTKMQLFFQKGSGFIGALLCKMRFEWTDKVPTAAVDGITLFWNPNFFMKLTPAHRITVLAHELWHVAFEHMTRINGRDAKKWNYAADYVINLHLADSGYDFKDLDCLLDYKYRGMSTVEVYDKLPPDPSDKGGSGLGTFGQDVLPPPDGKDAADVKNKIISNIIGAMTAAQMGGMKPGDIPGEITSEIDKFLNPKLPWETLLFNVFNEMCIDEYSYARPNRRYEDPMLPGKNGRNGLEHLMYFLDVSGSTSDRDVLRFNSEVKFIHETLQPEKLTLVQFDTKIQKIDVFERDDTFEKIIVQGRGGTSLRDVWKMANEENPTAVIIFTDLWVDIPREPLPMPTIWVCVNNKDGQVPFGKLIHITEPYK